MTTVSEIYESSIKCLPTSQRLILAKMILNDIPPSAVVDYSEEWTEQDYLDFTRTSMTGIDERLEEHEIDGKAG